MTAASGPAAALRVVVDLSDISPVRGKSRGIYSYARHLLTAMVPMLPQSWRLIVLCNGDSKADFVTLCGPNVEIEVVHERFPSTAVRVMWALGLGAWRVRRLDADVYFCPKGFAPGLLHQVGRTRRVVVTVHDLIPLWYAENHPEAVGWLEQTFVNNWLVCSIKSADRIIAVSQATASAVATRLGRRAGVDVVHNGVPALPRATRQGPRDCIFAMSSTLAHKNLKGVLGAYQRYRSLEPEPLPLTICGVTGEWGEGVTAVANVTPLELSNLYASARVFLFLPFIEGFGFPVLESLFHRTPVICSDIPSLRESSAGNALFVRPDDLDACAKALQSAAGEAPPRCESPLGSVGCESWNVCAQRTLALLGD